MDSLDPNVSSVRFEEIEQNKQLDQLLMHLCRCIIQNDNSSDEQFDNLTELFERMYLSGHSKMRSKQHFVLLLGDFEVVLREMLVELSQYLGSALILSAVHCVSEELALRFQEDALLSILKGPELPPLQVRNAVVLGALRIFTEQAGKIRLILKPVRESTSDTTLLQSLGRLLEGLEDARYAGQLVRVSEALDVPSPYRLHSSSPLSQWTLYVNRLTSYSSPAHLARRILVQLLAGYGGLAVRRCLPHHPTPSGKDYRRRLIWKLVRMGKENARAAMAELTRRTTGANRLVLLSLA
ncbi:hypothetical protein EON64_05240, partial [archaeon]